MSCVLFYEFATIYPFTNEITSGLLKVTNRVSYMPVLVLNLFVAKNLKVWFLLPLPPENWDCKPAPSCFIYVVGVD